MNKAGPVIHASADDRKQRRSHERHPVKRQRLQALYLLANGQARFRSDIACLRGIDRNTAGRWLERYAHGSVHAVLALSSPPGTAAALPPDQLALLQHALAPPQGLASSADVRPWISDTVGVALSYHATHKLVRYRLGAKRTVARPTQIKNR